MSRERPKLGEAFGQWLAGSGRTWCGSSFKEAMLLRSHILSGSSSFWRPTPACFCSRPRGRRVAAPSGAQAFLLVVVRSIPL